MAKSADDLKAILRTMTSKVSSERIEKKSQNQESLKGTLADVLKRSALPTPSPQKMPERPEVRPQSVGHKPFEVSEDALRKVLKGDT
jgi:hypothetical protein